MDGTTPSSNPTPDVKPEQPLRPIDTTREAGEYVLTVTEPEPTPALPADEE